MDRNKIIQTASIISVAGNAILAAAKIAAGILSGSLSVLGDGLDSLTDIFISLITLAISIIIIQPPDREHPHGHFRAETIATSVLAFIIFFIGGQLTLSSIGRLFSHDYNEVPGILSVYVTVISIIGKLLLSWSQFSLGRKAESPMIIANGRNMMNDIITSSGVLLGLGCIYFFNLPVIDRVLAILIGFWIMYSAVRIFMGTVTEMMDGVTDMSIYDRIFEEVRQVDGLSNPHRVRVRKVGAYYIIEMDVEADGNSTIKSAHDRVHVLENRIRNSIANIYDIVIHIEPLGNYDKHERWGLEEKDLP
jgi:cation diffusion facilitator family transporter